MSSTKFKVGDRVKLTSSCHTGAEVGSVLTIAGVDVIDATGEPWRYKLSDGRYCDNMSGSLELLLRDLDHLQEGDVLVDEEDDERSVLAVTGSLVALSTYSDPAEFCVWQTVDELKGEGYTVKGAEPEDDTIELTIEEIAELKGVSADKIRIKKEVE